MSMSFSHLNSSAAPPPFSPQTNVPWALTKENANRTQSIQRSAKTYLRGDKILTSSMTNRNPYFLRNLTSSGNGAKSPSMLNRLHFIINENRFSYY